MNYSAPGMQAPGFNLPGMGMLDAGPTMPRTGMASPGPTVAGGSGMPGFGPSMQGQGMPGAGGMGENGARQGRFLVIIDGQGFIQEIPVGRLPEERLYLGRSPLRKDGGSNQIVIPSPIVSSTHGKFKIVGNEVLYADLGSTNGTILESDGYQQILYGNREYVRLHEGSILRIQPQNGPSPNSVLIFLRDDSEEGTWRKFALLGRKTRIGRDMDNDIVLSHPSVSRFHAEILSDDSGKFTLVDNGSRNGVFLNGRRISGRKKLQEKDVIRIASHVLIFTHGVIFYKNRAQGITIEAENLNKFVGKNRKQILTNVSCTINSNDFVAIVGGSGAGKTTLMNAISGFDQKVSGKVWFNGIEVHDDFQAVKELIGYVPQEDIIYDNLTLGKMLWYTAKLKMPPDTTDAEKEKRISQVLNMVDLQKHKDTFIRKLSGGQKKRASIAVELLGDPSVFFLDEPTSGLDPGTEQKLMITLNKLSKSQGKTVVMVTHTTQSLSLCDKVIFMGPGGRLCFMGSTDQAKMFFGTEDLVEIYNRIAEDPEGWSAQFRNAVGGNSQGMAPDYRSQKRSAVQPKKTKGGGISQLPVLTARYFELIRNDVQRLLLLLLQPLLISMLLILVAGKDTYFVANDTQNILFTLSCAGIWIGLFNSIQEVCKERPILKREYMGNLKLTYYVLSKFIVQTVLGGIQALLLSAVTGYFIGLPAEGIFFRNPFPEVFITVWLTIEASMAIGFVVSSMVKNTDRAMVTAPFILIVQLLFSGILFELKGTAGNIAKLTISKWSMEALGSLAVINDLPISLQKKIPTVDREMKDIFLSTGSHLLKDWIILLIMTAVCGILCGILLRRVSKDSR